MLLPDTILQNRYRIVRQHGRGGMGAVYEAFDGRLNRTVALKETLVETEELRRAFEREAHLLANLRHPALPNVSDHFSESDGLFLVMEFIPGDDLGEMLEQKGQPFAAEQVLRWADELLDALEYLHTHEPPVLHRDIKPQNLKLTRQGRIILLDFGLAKGAVGQMSTVTSSKSILGYTPSYSALEQIQGTGTDERSDLYSLGATLYHLLTGVKPPDALTRATAVVNGQTDPLRPVHQVNSAISPNVSAALMRAMALNLDNRPRTASEMRADLHSTAPRAGATVAGDDAHETTRISLPTSTLNDAMPPPSLAPQLRTRGSQVVVPVPENDETVVAQKRSGGGGRGGWMWAVVVGLFLGVVSLFGFLYLSKSDRDRVARTSPNGAAANTNAARARNTNAQINSNQNVANQNVENLNMANQNVAIVDLTNQNITNQNVAVVEEISPAARSAREELTRRGIPVNEETFVRVVEAGDTAAVDLFLAAGVNPNARNQAGGVALLSAAHRGRDNITRKLLDKGADANARDDRGTTALMLAAVNDHKDTLRVLFDRNADANLQDNNGRTALTHAAAEGHEDAVRLLLNKGAKVNLRDSEGRTALTWAEINGHSNVARLLRTAGATRP
ncbi:MAG TPA: ankyrin repeat domain-containing protein [Pyrinomonadaceae bacterium]|jgi:serine/threonine protein kinase|nr:ankyrin repeat domain-containing protein [Pyrinomonadaceae bacterium]